jgi:secreted trypsin-like serine protease
VTPDGVGIKIIPLYSGSDLVEGTPVTASGWGATATSSWSNQLLTVGLKIKSAATCNLQDSDLALVTCAVDTGKDTCAGDSGGPLAVDVGGVTRLYGVVSYGASKNCGVAPIYGVYTKVSAYSSWIASTQNGILPPPNGNGAVGKMAGFLALFVSSCMFVLWC